MQINPKKLKLKGWSEEDIKRAINILEKAEAKKNPAHYFLDKAVFIIALLLAVMGNIFIAVRVIPLLATLNDAYLSLILIIIGLAFGSLFAVLIHDIERLSFGHHLIASIVMPVTAVITLIMIIEVTNRLSSIEGFQSHNPWLIGIIYAIAFLIPYVVYLAALRKK
ncbi:MAG: hypothetical protein ABIE94_06535 [archaeon]